MCTVLYTAGGSLFLSTRARAVQIYKDIVNRMTSNHLFFEGLQLVYKALIALLQFSNKVFCASRCGLKCAFTVLPLLL